MALTLTRGDTEPILTATLERDGSPYDLSALSNPTVRLLMASDDTIVETTMTIVDAPNGHVQHEWTADETSTPGVYDAQFIVEGDDVQTTFPSSGPATIYIRDRVTNDQ